ncbi:MAG TPA: methyltransferase domain-containing protein [Candidatus Paceibacterota bacterium]|nr:methyltransferase domain-containing protein [Verrucomicrobiota bacterium]HRY51521.1 methyltransferase domain-containing protein [Candidatus Paceibacterota bacterium]HSA02319.1 methyltransferase domain-containing protein [Candidatus Paceibacterota bacterium]
MAYVHGYSERETQRLYEQAGILEDILHSGTAFSANARVLEAGCGVGAQTRLLMKRSPEAVFTCIDLSEKSLATASRLKAQPEFRRVTFLREDITRLGFAEESFDHVFVCFVLEHLDAPVAALKELKRALRTGGTITVIEGDHGSCFWHPETPESVAAWNGLIAAQRNIGHDPNIGRRLAPLLTGAGFALQTCEPAWLYADRLKPALRDGMVDHIIVPMVQSAEERILADHLVPKPVYEKGIADLSRVDQLDEGTFFYTWFKAVARKP